MYETSIMGDLEASSRLVVVGGIDFNYLMPQRADAELHSLTDYM